MRFFTLLIGMLLLVTVGTLSAQDDGALYTTESVPCPRSFAFETAEVEGQTYECGVVHVPLNYDAPEDTALEITYMILHSTSLSPAPDPVIYLSGGPGSSALNEVTRQARLYQSLNTARQRRDVIVFDQRGTGNSSLLTCGPFQTALGVIEELYPDLAPTVADLADQNINEVILTLAACAEGYRASAFDLAYINSVSSAYDIQSLADALGYTGQYNLVGASYGTRLALEAMRTTPDRVRTAVLDGVIPPNVDDIYYFASLPSYQYQTIFAGCVADPACNEAYPNIEQRFIDLLARLQTDPIVFDPPLPANAALQSIGVETIPAFDARFFVTLATFNNKGGDIGGLIPRMILAIENDEVDSLLVPFFSASLTESAQADGVIDTVVTQPQVITPESVFFAQPIDQLLTIAQIDVATIESAPDLWVKLVIDELAERLTSGETQIDVIQDMLQMLLLPLQGTDADALVQFANDHTSPETAATLNSIVSQMTRTEVRQTMWGIGDVAARLNWLGTNERNHSDMMQYAVNCPDNLSLLTVEDAEADVENNPYPGLNYGTPEGFEAQFLFPCQYLPESVLGESAVDPVVSDIPTLVLTGGIDNQTPFPWAQRTLETLSNAYSVEFQTQGHIQMNHRGNVCASDIIASFLDDPSREPNMSCAEAFRFQYQLP